ncbi:unnamed protein product, partial [Prorocentrum cordatum]
MVALGQLASDEPLVQVPAKNALQVTTGGECPIGDQVAPAAWAAVPWWAQLAVLLAYERHRKGASPLEHWVASLPQEFPEVPLNWTDAELEALDYPLLERDIREQREEVAGAYSLISAGCRFPLSEDDFRWAVMAVRSRSFSGPYEGRGPEERLAQVALVAALLVGGVASGLVSAEDGLNGAGAALVAIPLTDFLVGQSSNLKRYVICPVIDYHNHESSAASDISYEYFANEFVLRVRGAFAAGDQVCINYGEKRSNDALLQYYGFIEKDNPNDVYSMDILAILDPETAATGQSLQVDLTRRGPDERSMRELRLLLADDAERRAVAERGGEGLDEEISGTNEALVWRAVDEACEAELRRLPAGEALELAAATLAGPALLAARLRAEKERVLASCRAFARAMCRQRASAAPLSLATGAVVTPTFQDAAGWRHAWADELLRPAHLEALRAHGFCLLPGAFDAGLAARCLRECRSLGEA